MMEFPELGLTAPDGAIIGVIEEGTPVLSRGNCGQPVPQQPGNFLIDHAFAHLDAAAKARAASRLIELRRAGATFVILSHDEALLAACADEIWWLRDGRLIARADPAEVLEHYRRHVAHALRETGGSNSSAIAPSLREGDGRAVVESIELLGADSAPTIVWKSGEAAAVRVTVRFAGDVEDPVIGILIRTRIGLNVYGTNTELENIHFGPVQAGDRVRIVYRFRCELCPGDYTLTAASHDRNGLRHDWLEDAVSFSIADGRYTAGVANLRAQVIAEVLPRG